MPKKFITESKKSFLLKPISNKPRKGWEQKIKNFYSPVCKDKISPAIIRVLPLPVAIL